MRVDAILTPYYINSLSSQINAWICSLQIADYAQVYIKC